MSRLEDKFRERLLGQLSDANTEVDVRVAVEVCKQEMLLFQSFLRENYYVDEALNGDFLSYQEVQDVSTLETMRVEKALEKYLNRD